MEETLRGKGCVLQEEAVGSVLRLSRAAPDNSNDHAGTRGDVKELWYVGTKEEAISPRLPPELTQTRSGQNGSKKTKIRGVQISSPDCKPRDDLLRIQSDLQMLYGDALAFFAQPPRCVLRRAARKKRLKRGFLFKCQELF
jgi:hypothetical protein